MNVPMLLKKLSLEYDGNSQAQQGLQFDQLIKRFVQSINFKLIN